MNKIAPLSWSFKNARNPPVISYFLQALSRREIKKWLVKRDMTHYFYCASVKYWNLYILKLEVNQTETPQLLGCTLSLAIEIMYTLPILLARPSSAPSWVPPLIWTRLKTFHSNGCVWDGLLRRLHVLYNVLSWRRQMLWANGRIIETGNYHNTTKDVALH